MLDAPALFQTHPRCQVREHPSAFSSHKPPLCRSFGRFLSGPVISHCFSCCGFQAFVCNTIKLPSFFQRALRHSRVDQSCPPGGKSAPPPLPSHTWMPFTVFFNSFVVSLIVNMSAATPCNMVLILEISANIFSRFVVFPSGAESEVTLTSASGVLLVVMRDRAASSKYFDVDVIKI